MSMQISDASRPPASIVTAGLALLITGACGDQAARTANTRVLAHAEAQQRAMAEDDGHILCAHAGMAFTRSCTIDRMEEARGLTLTIRHADGGFHRLLVTRDGRGVVAADGVDYALVTVVGTDGIEVAIGGDRYRLPATIRRGARGT